jgi:hypothetical protein
MIGYCLGGTLLGDHAGLHGRQEGQAHRLRDLLHHPARLRHPGELGVFIDEGQVASLEKKMFERGYLEGSEMAGTFNMLRSNDLIWSFVVNNYLLGKEPFPFDLLYWNSDSTRMPYKMHSFYLRNMYLGTTCSASRAASPSRHADRPLQGQGRRPTSSPPSKTTSRRGRAPISAPALRRPVRFVLGGSGHIAGIVNPPCRQQVRLLDQRRRPARHRRRVVRRRQAAPGLVVDRLAAVDHLAAYAAKVAHHTGPVQPEPAALPRCKDRDDQKFLELARDAGADWLVTADKALLRLARGGRLRGLFRILTPEAALAET